MEQVVGRACLDEDFQAPEGTEKPSSRPDRVSGVSVKVLFCGEKRRCRCFIRHPDVLVVGAPAPHEHLFVVRLLVGMFSSTEIVLADDGVVLLAVPVHVVLSRAVDVGDIAGSGTFRGHDVCRQSSRHEDAFVGLPDRCGLDAVRTECTDHLVASDVLSRRDLLLLSVRCFELPLRSDLVAFELCVHVPGCLSPDVFLARDPGQRPRDLAVRGDLDGRITLRTVPVMMQHLLRCHFSPGVKLLSGCRV